MCLDRTVWTKEIAENEPIIAWKAMIPIYGEEIHAAPVQGGLYSLDKVYKSLEPGFHAFATEAGARSYALAGETIRRVLLWGQVTKGEQAIGWAASRYEPAYAAQYMRMV